MTATLHQIPSLTLDRRAEMINDAFASADKREVDAGSDRIRAGSLLIEARAHVPDGQWEAWCEANIRRSQQDIRKVMKIAGSADPAAALRAEMSARASGMRAHRAHVGAVASIQPRSPTPPTPAETAYLQKLEAAARDVLGGSATVAKAVELHGVPRGALNRAVSIIRGPAELWAKVKRREITMQSAVDGSIAARGSAIGPRIVKSSNPVIAQVNDLYEEVAGFFIQDFGPRFIEWVSNNPRLSDEAIAVLHNAIDGCEQQCAMMRKALQELRK